MHTQPAQEGRPLLRTIRGRRYVYWRRCVGVTAHARPRYHDLYLGVAPPDLPARPRPGQLSELASRLLQARDQAPRPASSAGPAWPRLMNKVGRAHLTWKKLVERPFLKLEINLKELVLLRTLRAENALAVSAVAELVYCDRDTAVRILDRLQDRGIVAVDRDPVTGRRTQVKLTREGAKRLKAADALSLRVRPSLPDPFLSFTPRQVREMERLLDLLNAAVAAAASPSQPQENLRAAHLRRGQ